MEQTQQERLIARESPESSASKDQDLPGAQDGTLKRNDFNYKPGMLRTLSLLLLAVYGLALVAILEVAMVKLPHDDGIMNSIFANDSISRREAEWLVARDSYIETPSEASSTSRAATAYVSPSGAQTVDSTVETPVLTLTEVSSRAATAYMSPSGARTVDATVVTTVLSPTFAQPPATLTQATGAYLQPEGSVATSTANMGAYVQAEGSIATSSLTTQDTAYIVPTGSYVPPEGPITKGNAASQTSRTVPVAYIDPTGSANANVTGSPSYAGLQQHKDQAVTYEWPVSKAFIFTYMPVILAVIFRILVAVVLAELSLIDPFRQLAQQDGASARHAFSAFYQCSSGLRSLFQALGRSRWALAGIAAAYGVSCLLPALASEAIWVSTRYNCEVEFYPGTNNPCAPRATASSPVIRVLQGFLAFDTLAILGLSMLMSFGKTGLHACPSSIATVASLMQHPGLAEEINNLPLDQRASMDATRSLLRDKRFKLGFWKNENGGTSYGIRPVARSSQASDAFQSSSTSRISHPYDSISGDPLPASEQSRSRFRWQDLSLLLVTLGTFAVVLAYYLDGSNSGFNRFFNGNTFGPRFILTLAATMIAAMWKSAEQRSIVMAPLTRLYHCPSSAGSTLCFSSSMAPLLSTWKAIRGRYWLLASMTVITLLAEVLSIVISTIPYAYGVLWVQFLACTYMTIGILALMVIVSVLVILHRRREPRLPARPDTLGMKMYYLAGSRMLDDFDGVEWESVGRRDSRIKSMKKLYEFKPKMKLEGGAKWLVDEVEEAHFREIS